jgi:hypothetical protein
MSHKGKLFLIFSLFLLPVFGCTTGNVHAPAKLSGKITYAGNSVTAGTLLFYTGDSGVYPAVINSDGTYSATDLPAGDLVVTIETESANPNVKKQEYKGGAGGGGMYPGGKAPAGGAGDHKGPGAQNSPKPENAPQGGGPYVKIPSKYSDKNKSGLTVKLSAGKNTQDFDLKD